MTEYQSNLRELRDKVGLTQEQVAHKLGLSLSTYRNWETGREGVKMFERVMNLCEVFQCDPKDLIREITPES